jgi:hypothetical protein
MPMTDYPPCPFCGSTNLVDGHWYIDDEEHHAVECDDCKAGAPASVWNIRAGEVRRDTINSALNTGEGVQT